MSTVLDLYTKATRLPQGRRVFSLLFSQKAPYFASIRPTMTELRPNYAAVRIRNRRRVHNHIGTVHAIALCNLAELAAGVMTEATIPADKRWIPKGMSVEYLKKAKGTMHGVATPEAAVPGAGDGGEWPVRVEVADDAGETVFRARVLMWVSPRRRG